MSLRWNFIAYRMGPVFARLYEFYRLVRFQWRLSKLAMSVGGVDKLTVVQLMEISEDHILSKKAVDIAKTYAILCKIFKLQTDQTNCVNVIEILVGSRASANFNEYAHYKEIMGSRYHRQELYELMVLYGDIKYQRMCGILNTTQRRDKLLAFLMGDTDEIDCSQYR